MTESPGTYLSPIASPCFLLAIGIMSVATKILRKRGKQMIIAQGLTPPDTIIITFVFYSRKYMAFKLLFWTSCFKVYIYYCHYRVNNAGYFQKTSKCGKTLKWDVVTNWRQWATLRICGYYALRK